MATVTEKIEANYKMINKSCYCLRKNEDGTTGYFYGFVEGLREDGETFIVRNGSFLIDVNMFDIRSID